MNEAQTRFNKIDPKLRDAGWGIVPGSKIEAKSDEKDVFRSWDSDLLL